MSKWGWVACALVLASSVSYGAEEDARAAKTMWSAFVCASYADMSNQPEEQRRLFQLGYTSGKQFLAAVEAGTITNQEGMSIVPVGVSELLSGPTTEFINGRIYESASSYAYESVVKKDADGLPLDVKEWAVGSALQQTIASNRYSKSNCDLIR